MTAHLASAMPDVDAQRRYVVGLIGEGIGASLTPSLHEAEAAALGLDYSYRIFDLLALGHTPDAVGPLLARAREQGYCAMNITHPCKQRVIDELDELDPDAERLGAVNLVLFEDGRLVGHNTDWMGYRDGLRAGLPGALLDHVVQLGCGGAGAATAYALLTCGATRLTLSDVDPARARSLAARMQHLFPAQVTTAVTTEELPGMLGTADGVVHATPLGMAHHPGVAFDVSLLRPGAWVSDIVYRPLETRLIRAATALGHPVLDGGHMAVGQAFASLEAITGRHPDRARMKQHFRTLVALEETAVARDAG